MNNILDEFLSQREQQPNKAPRPVMWEDVAIEFIHPITGNVIVDRDYDAVENAIRNICLTPLKSRPFHPKFGTRLPSLLFEPDDISLRNEVRSTIRAGLKKFEPRIENLKIDISEPSDNQTIRIDIQYTLQNKTSLYEYSFTLKTIR